MRDTQPKQNVHDFLEQKIPDEYASFLPSIRSPLFGKLTFLIENLKPKKTKIFLMFSSCVPKLCTVFYSLGFGFSQARFSGKVPGRINITRRLLFGDF